MISIELQGKAPKDSIKSTQKWREEKRRSKFWSKNRIWKKKGIYRKQTEKKVDVQDQRNHK